MSGIAIIANPHSKLNKRNPWRQKLLSYIVGEQGRVEITNSLEDLKRVALELKERNIKILAINGGDGTISQTLTAFIRAYEGTPLPKVAVLKGGTMNMLATNLDIKGTPEEILYRLVDFYSTAKPLPVARIHTLEVDGQYGFMFGNGLSSEFLDLFYKNKTGPLGVIALIGRIVASVILRGGLFRRLIKRLPTIISWDKASIKHRSLLVLCSTVKKMPMGPLLFPKAGAGSGQMQCLSITEQPERAPWQMVRTLLFSGREHDVKGQFSVCAQGIDIESELNSLYTIDGELLKHGDGKKLSVRLGPEIEFVTV